MQIASTKMKHLSRIIQAVEVITRSLQNPLCRMHLQGYQSCAPTPHFSPHLYCQLLLTW